jgi:hypothetical protein
MKKIYIFILELIISVTSLVLKKNNIEEEPSEDSSEDVPESNTELSRSSRNTFYKLLLLKEKFKQNNKKL